MTWGLPRQPPRLSHRVRSGDSMQPATASHHCQPDVGLLQITQHAQRVHLRPALDDLPAGKAIDIDAGEVRSLAVRRHAEPWTVIGAGSRPAHDYEIAIVYRVVDSQGDIRERGE